MSGSPDRLCPCCESPDLRLLGTLPDSSWFAGRRLAQPLAGGKLYHCRRCFLKFRHPVQAADAYQAHYDNALTSNWSDDESRQDWNLIIDRVEQRLPRGGKILDVGCYSGGLLSRLGPTHERYGLEINRAAAAAAADRSRGRIWPSLDAVPDEIRFDVLIAADVVEHVPDPASFIKELSGLLNADGILIVTTGDADNFLWRAFGANWWYCFFPEHISFISERWLAYLTKSSELSVLHCNRFRYSNLPAWRRITDSMLAIFYGFAPRIYLSLGASLKQLFRRDGGVPVRGVGISSDHLLVVLNLKGARP